MEQTKVEEEEEEEEKEEAEEEARRRRRRGTKMGKEPAKGSELNVLDGLGVTVAVDIVQKRERSRLGRFDWSRQV